MTGIAAVLPWEKIRFEAKAPAQTANTKPMKPDIFILRRLEKIDLGLSDLLFYQRDHRFFSGDGISPAA
jgi:hypothetical protein